MSDQQKPIIELDFKKPMFAIDFEKTIPNLKNIRGYLNWDPHPVPTEKFDLDILCFVLTEEGYLTASHDVVFYNQRIANGVLLSKDNTDGKGDNDENISFELDKIAAYAQTVAIFISLHDADRRSQNFGQIRNASFDLQNVGDNNASIQKYNLSALTEGNMLHAAELNRNQTKTGWIFNPIGQVKKSSFPELVHFYTKA